MYLKQRIKKLENKMSIGKEIPFEQTEKFRIMQKALTYLTDEELRELNQVILIEKGHLSPELEAAWRRALKQAEKEGP